MKQFNVRLNNVLANDAYDAEKALVLYDGNLVCKENITNFVSRFNETLPKR